MVVLRVDIRLEVMVLSGVVGSGGGGDSVRT